MVSCDSLYICVLFLELYPITYLCHHIFSRVKLKNKPTLCGSYHHVQQNLVTYGIKKAFTSHVLNKRQTSEKSLSCRANQNVEHCLNMQDGGTRDKNVVQSCIKKDIWLHVLVTNNAACCVVQSPKTLY